MHSIWPEGKSSMDVLWAFLLEIESYICSFKGSDKSFQTIYIEFKRKTYYNDLLPIQCRNSNVYNLTTC
jgi:hypothetical protein